TKKAARHEMSGCRESKWAENRVRLKSLVTRRASGWENKRSLKTTPGSLVTRRAATRKLSCACWYRKAENTAAKQPVPWSRKSSRPTTTRRTRRPRVRKPPNPSSLIHGLRRLALQRLLHGQP